MEKMRKVAIVRRNGLGDLLLAYPLMHLIKEQNPEVSLTLFVDERNAPLLRYFPPIFENAIVFPKHGNKYLNSLRLGVKFRKEKFDLAVSAKTSPMKLMNLFLGILGAKKTIAYVGKKKWSNVFISEKRVFHVERASNSHQALKGIRLIDPHATTVDERLYPKLSIPKDISERYPPSFSQTSLRILLSASTTNIANRIDEDKYTALINRLYTYLPFSVVVIAQKHDQERAFRIEQKLNVPKTLFFPRNFDEFMVSLNQCDVYFVPDGGIAHIGAGLDKNQVVLFGSTSPAQWAPLSKKATIFYHPHHVDALSCDEILNALLSRCEGAKNGRIHM